MPIIVSLILWLLVLGLVVGVDPDRVKDIPVAGSYGPLFILVGLAVWWSASLVLKNKRRGILVTMVIIGILVLSLIKLGYWFNVALLIGLAVAVDSVFTKLK